MRFGLMLRAQYPEGDDMSARFQELLERSARWLDVHLRSEDLALGNFVREGQPAPKAARP